jgi:hypothetical protein
MVRTWAEKEIRNLVRMHSEGLPVPAPILLRGHVLLMDFIGKDGWPAPKLKVATAVLVRTVASLHSFCMLHKVATECWRYAHLSTSLVPKTTKWSHIKFGMVVLDLKVLGVFVFGSYPSSKMPILLEASLSSFTPYSQSKKDLVYIFTYLVHHFILQKLYICLQCNFCFFSLSQHVSALYGHHQVIFCQKLVSLCGISHFYHFTFTRGMCSWYSKAIPVLI